MKRLRLLLALAVCVVAVTVVFAGPAASQQPPRHPHMLVLGIKLDSEGEPVSYRRCVDLAANQRLPLSAHHAHMHTGRAGEALFTKAGHVAVPGAPLTPWRNCAELVAFFFGD